MIIYENTRGGFVNDVRSGSIATKVQAAFERHGIHHNNDSEYRAWSNSLMYMRNVLDDDAIPEDIALAIEYQIPLTSKRVDFLLAGRDENDIANVVVIELKQWEDSGMTSRPDVVTAYTGGANRAVCHPSYQAYSYAKIIETFNEDVHRGSVRLRPCAYLHNYREQNREVTLRSTPVSPSQQETKKALIEKLAEVQESVDNSRNYKINQVSSNLDRKSKKVLGIISDILSKKLSKFLVDDIMAEIIEAFERK